MKPSHKKLLLYSILLIVFIGGGFALYQVMKPFKPYNVNSKNQAIRGYDTVAYFTVGKPTKGVLAYSYDWEGATWLFANAEHLERFKANPLAYIPQYGGYCAWAVAAKGKLANIDPTVWKIVDGKLYLNYNKKIGKRWQQAAKGFIVEGDQQWPELLRRKQTH